MNYKNLCLYYGKKILVFIISVFILSIVVFYIARLAPGDPLFSYYGSHVEKMSIEERKWAEQKLGLNAPIHIQYIQWFTNAVKGNFGISFKYKTDVLKVIKERLPNTLLLGGIGFLMIFILSPILAIVCSLNEDSWFDKLICKTGAIISCIPEFWLALVLVFIFAIKLKWLPSSGAYSIGNENNVFSHIYHLILPMIVVVLNHLWYYTYMVRNRLLEETKAGYVLLAKSKGLDKKSILFMHCLRNVIPSYLSIMAISVPHILGGTYIVETVFSYPGIGTLSYESARYKDYNLLMVLCIFSGTLIILCNIIAQIISERIDPRLKESETIEASEVTDVG